jgi:hypothetical protein
MPKRYRPPRHADRSIRAAFVSHRYGQQADALEAFLAARRVLVDEVGVEPGPELRAAFSRPSRARPRLDVPPTTVARARRHGTLPAPATVLLGRQPDLDGMALSDR